MRGNPRGRRHAFARPGSIPAHAGKPSSLAVLGRDIKVYPRPCGETLTWPPWPTPNQGLSPPMRGNRQCSKQQQQRQGSIPAHAGKPGIVVVDTTNAAGLSPPMRGNRGGGDAQGERQGSIPAHAGKPPAGDLCRADTQVYPRPCGETASPGVWTVIGMGLSPPMRGNPVPVVSCPPSGGSIPAHAGKPSANCRSCRPSWVYPRPCGETLDHGATPSGPWGLSPPMRGNPFLVVKYQVFFGSIPAHAGKPLESSPCLVLPGVYPRPCGETTKSFGSVNVNVGLSPPMRGNHYTS